MGRLPLARLLAMRETRPPDLASITVTHLGETVSHLGEAVRNTES